MPIHINDHQLLRYSRHILLDEIGIEGQEKLLQAHAVIIGCGGLGSAAAPYLAASGIGRLTLVDFDCIDESNLQRQIMFAEADIGSRKAETLKCRLNALNSMIQIDAINARADEAQLISLMQAADVVLDCSDNFATRQAVNRAAVATLTPLVSGAAVRFDGQLAVFRSDLPESPCYACLFDGSHASDGACALFGVFSPLFGIIGAAQAAEALKIVMNTGSSVHGVLRIYEALSGEWQQLAFDKNPHCRVCGG